MSQIAGYNASITGLTGTENENSWSLDLSGDALDVTDFTSTGPHTYIAGLTDWSGSVECFIDDTTSPPAAGTSITGAKFYVDATRYLTGNLIITGVSFDVGVSDAETYSVEFQGTDGISYSGW